VDRHPAAARNVNVDRVIALLRQLEGWRDYVYDDKSPWPRSEVSRAECVLSAGQYKVLITGGTATVGYGETGADFIDRYWGRRITQGEALAKMAERVPGFYQGVLGCIDADLTEHQWEAITCRAYQTGAGGFCRSETARLLDLGEIAGAVARWLKEFAHPDRSEVEIAHFLTPDDTVGGSPMKFVSRAEWGADDPGGITPAPGMTRGVGVHWLGGGRGPTQHSQCAAKMREVQAFHTGPQRGWADFAYNDGACCHGYVFEGRGPRVRNAANGGGTRAGFDANAGWASILYLAGTDGPDLTPEGMDAINDSAVRLGVAGGEWLGHADFLSTECPGDDAYVWVHTGHPRGTGAVPIPTEPQPEPDLEVATMFIFDASPARGGGIYYTDGATWKRGVPNGNSLVFYATGKVPHVGVLPDDVFDAIPFASAGLDELAADVAAALVGPLAVAMEQSDFETGDPGCAGAAG
jgi:GH24 family phage-related lysozyme (muramidase)